MRQSINLFRLQLNLSQHQNNTIQVDIDFKLLKEGLMEQNIAKCNQYHSHATYNMKDIS